MLPNFKQQFAALIAAPSISSIDARWDMSNQSVLDLLATWLTDLDFEVTLQNIDNSSDNKTSKFNLIATYRPSNKDSEQSGGLLLSGHTDTVPFDESLWQTDPFVLHERDGQFLGLGVSDMKGFFPVVIEALKNIPLKQLKKPLTILATADEESTMNGARALLKNTLLRPAYAVIGEPTNLAPVYMHKGMMMESIRVQGVAGHSSNPALGKNALDAMHDVLGVLLDYRSQLQKKFNNDAFAVAFPTLNLGCIHGGDSPNRICSRCEMHFDLRPLPGMDIAVLQNEIDKALKPVRQKHQVSLERHSSLIPIAPFAENKNSDWVRLCELYSGQAGSAVAFSTEAPFLQQLGMETIIMGPGSIDQAHQANEYMSTQQVEPAVKLLQNLIKKICY